MTSGKPNGTDGDANPPTDSTDSVVPLWFARAPAGESGAGAPAEIAPAGADNHPANAAPKKPPGDLTLWETSMPLDADSRAPQPAPDKGRAAARPGSSPTGSSLPKGIRPTAVMHVADPARYQVKSEHARGGMGRIMLALDRAFGREVAIKELLLEEGGHNLSSFEIRPDAADNRTSSQPTPDPVVLERFLREARITGLLEHPNIVPVYEIGRRPDGTHYYTMKFVRGRTLGSRLSEIAADKTLDAREKLAARLKLMTAFAEVCNAVAYAHSRKVIHRDLKPDNIMLGEFGETVILDWGLAHMEGEPELGKTTYATKEAFREAKRKLRSGSTSTRLTIQGEILGTPNYMAPEQARGELSLVDAKTDVYALGAILYEIVTGRRAYSGDSAVDILDAVEMGPPVEVEAVCPVAPPELASLVGRAMARERGERIESARLLASEAEAWRDGRALTTYSYSAGEQLRRLYRTNRATVLVGIIALLALAAGGVYSYLRISDQIEAAVSAKDDADLARDAASRALTLAESRERDTNEAKLRVDAERTRADAAAKDALNQKARADEKADEALRNAAAADAEAERVRIESAAGRTLSSDLKRVLISPDGRFALSAGGSPQLTLWRLHGNRGMSPVAFGEGHTDGVFALAMTADGKWAVSGGQDRTVRLWRLDLTGEGTVRAAGAGTGHTDRVTSVCVSPDKRWALTSSLDRTVRLWRLNLSGEGAILAAGEGRGHTGSIDTMQFTPDSRWALSAGSDTVVRLWRIDEDNAGAIPCAAEGKGHSAPIRTIAISPDQQWAASGGNDNIVRLWRLDTRREGDLRPAAEGKAHTNWVRGVAFTADQRWLVTAANDGAVRLWRLDLSGDGALAPTGEGKGNGDRINVFALASDSRWAVTVGEDKALRLWRLDLAGGTVHAAGEGRGHADGISLLDVAPDGKWALSGATDHTIRLWRLDTRGEGAVYPAGAGGGHVNSVRTIAVAPDGKWAVSGGNDNDVHLWRIDTAGEGRIHPAGVGKGHADKVTCLAFTRDGRWAVSGCNDGTVRLWKLDTGGLGAIQPAGLGVGHSNWVRAVALSPDGRWALSASNDLTLRLWRLELGTEGSIRSAAEGKGHTASVTSLAVSADWQWAVTGSVDKTVRLWRLDLAGEGAIRAAGEGTGHLDRVLAVAMSGDGRWAVSSSGDYSVRLWRLDTAGDGAISSAGTGTGHSAAVPAVVISADGRWAASAGRDKTVRLWSLTLSGDGAIRAAGIGKGHTDKLAAVAATPDGNGVLSVGDDNTVRRWKADPGADGGLTLVETQTPDPFDGGVATGVFSADGRWLITGDTNWVMSLWRVSADGRLVLADQR